MNENTFCIMTHKGFFIQPNGKVKPCCVFKNFEPNLIYDEALSFDELYNSPQFNDLREKMDNGIIHSGCVDCFNGRINHREGMNKLFKENFLFGNIQDETISNEILHFDIRSSNKCNFKCRICNPTYSSSWTNELKKLKLSQPDTSIKMTEKWLAPIEHQFNNLKFIYLGGGEPLLMDDTFKILEKINHRKHEIHLFINTNLSTVQYKGMDIIDMLVGYKKVSLYISCDGFGEVGEYQRTGFKTKKFKKNLLHILSKIKNLKEFEISISYVLSAINVFSVFDFLKEIKHDCNIDDAMVWLLFLNTPWYYSVASGNDNFKKEVINFINDHKNDYGYRIKDQFDNFIFYVNNTHREKTDNDSNDFKFIKIIDEHRNTDIMKVAPWVKTDIFNYL
jgi:MoaA/NifB/PqqE/SkfB family radical SAM enzyme